MADPLTATALTAGTRTVGGAVSAAVAGRFSATAVMRVGKAEERRDLYLRFAEATAQYTVLLRIAAAADAPGLPDATVRLDNLTVAALECARACAALEVVGSGAVRVAAHDVMLALRPSKHATGDEEELVTARLLYAEACRIDLAYQHSPYSKWGRLRGWWPNRKSAKRREDVRKRKDDAKQLQQQLDVSEAAKVWAVQLGMSDMVTINPPTPARRRTTRPARLPQPRRVQAPRRNRERREQAR